MRRNNYFVFSTIAFSAVVLPIFCGICEGAEFDVSGSWRAEVNIDDEHEEIFVSLSNDNIASITIPVIRAYQIPIGAYEVLDRRLTFPGIDWSIDISPDDQVLSGKVPNVLSPVRQINATFTRVSSVPEPAPLPAPRMQPPDLVWRKDLNSPVWAGLATDKSQKSIFAATDDGVVYSLDAQTGAEHWKTELGATIRATPTVGDGILLVSTDSAAFSLDIKTGLQKWAVAYDKELSPRLPISDPDAKWDHYSSSIIIAGSAAIVASRDGCVRALYLANGEEIWKSCGNAIFTATPAIIKQAVAVSDFDGKVQLLRISDGASVWTWDAGGAVARDLSANGGQIFVGSRTFDLTALAFGDGTPNWQRHFWFSWIDSPPRISRGDLFVGSSDLLAVQSFRKKSGKLNWRSQVPGWSWPQIAIGGDFVVAACVGGESYFSERKGALIAFDRISGEILWILENDGIDPATHFSGIASSPIIVGSRIVAADLSGAIFAAEYSYARNSTRSNIRQNQKARN